ncbi:nitrite/sulfite reductase [Aquirhabdus parva]|uniref:Nitrite/sulfite reductase n=1 Tax=Aquirhabdus parva TaxID=2283318 RepID=A0A345P6K3_9GAMM|nr:nitrite/sulfite reductase [Aquirhabdus parva]AXI02912.1 nitrite/sulfite reductase [Aquirhabdus parva]
MYVYTEFDQALVDERVAQFRDQTQRFLSGTLSEDEFRPLRLQNGLYVQRYAPMLRIAVPYGVLNSKQIRKIASISQTYDRGYAHISTRQNIQLNWPALENVPDILAELATVQMHAIQTSGNCIRNTTTDQFAGRIQGEVADPRPTCEIIRQWSTFHPEFAFLPRKFKIAVSALNEIDRAATAFHDIGVYLVKKTDVVKRIADYKIRLEAAKQALASADVNGDQEEQQAQYDAVLHSFLNVDLVEQALNDEPSEWGYQIMAGGGLGRTPIIGSIIREFLPREDLIAYLEAVLRVYNLHGRRDNKYKARIKILVKALTPAVFASKAEAEFNQIRAELKVPSDLYAKMEKNFSLPAYQALPDLDFTETLKANPVFANWYRINTHPNKTPGYRIVNISLKRAGIAPGDATSEELDLIADLADKYSFGELRSTHEQNIVLADVEQSKLFELWETLTQYNLARAHIGFLTDIICCPGGDFCSLANAKSIPISEAISRRYEDLDTVYNLGHLDLNISGCMNACGHHHVGHIGILGVDKKGDEFYQISLGGNAGHDSSLGDILGPSFGADEVADIVEEILNTYLDNRQTINDETERFIDTYRRIGLAPFKERVYAK